MSNNLTTRFWEQQHLFLSCVSFCLHSYLTHERKFCIQLMSVVARLKWFNYIKQNLVCHTKYENEILSLWQWRCLSRGNFFTLQWKSRFWCNKDQYSEFAVITFLTSSRSHILLRKGTLLICKLALDLFE